MAVQPLVFSKNWNDPIDFPTVESSEVQVRADMQLLHDETKAKLNELIDDYGASAPRALTEEEIEEAIEAASV